MSRTAASSNEAKYKIAKRRIESFSKRFGEPHFYLACHAAFPLALTPDLLYRLWANFQQDVNSNLVNIPWIAVGDLLLSNLCNEVGYELYEIDWAIRNELLNQLKNNTLFGQQRVLELSEFLLAYMREQLNSSNPDTRDFAQAQKWTALAYAQPHEAAREIASNLASLNIEDGSEWIRLTSLVETLAEPLVDYEPLLVYVSGMKSFARGNVSEAKNLLSQIMYSKDEIKVAGVKLLIPDQFKAKPIPKVSFKIKRHRWLIGVSLAVAVVGILESSPTHDQAQNQPTPAQSPVSITPEPTTVQEPQKQEVSPVPPSPFPTQSAQLPSSTQPQIDRLTPEQAVKNLFDTINKRDFQAAWNQLSPNYQNNKSLHPDGYLSYIDWWGGKVQSVNVEQVSLVEATAQTATVNANIRYFMKTGKVVPASVSFFLLWDAQNSRWVVSDTK